MKQGATLSLPKGWEIKKLGEVCELSAGGDVPKDYFSEIQTEKYQIPIYANGEKNEGLYGYTTIAKIVKPSITVSARGTIGFSVKRLEPFFPIVRLIVVSPIDLKKLSLDFLDYALRKIDFKHSGSSIPQLTVPMIRDYEIPLPPLPEQQRIVSILDECFAAIDKAKANAEQNLKNAKELFESYLQGVFDPSTRSVQGRGDGWEEKTIGDIGSPKMCKRIFKEQTTSVGDIPFYKIGTFGKEPDAFISKDIYDEFRAKYSFPKKGDILISASGTIGRRVRYDGEPAYFQDSNIVWIENDEKQVSNDFLYEFYGACNWGSTKGATISRLYNDNLKSIKISFPKSLKAQQTIVRQLDALRAETQKLEAMYEKKVADLEELKKSILQKAFAGEIESVRIRI
jgi:type I restriction enzyme S subunit